MSLKKPMIILFLFAAGCLGRFTETGQPTYFKIEYQNEETSCPSGFKKPLQIWPFTSTAPYDRNEMVILGPSREVKFSSLYQWIGTPGEMITDALIRDFTGEDLFSMILTPADPFQASLQLRGTVFQFAWEEENSKARAVLDVEISVWRQADQSDVLLKNKYRFESPSLPRDQPDLFAGSMSTLVKKLSTTLKEDLCALTNSVPVHAQ